MRLVHKDVLAGVLFILLGSWFGVDALLHLTIGTPFRMGPGFFPVILGAGLLVLGIAIAAVGWRSQASPPDNPVPWRAIGLLTLSPVLFGLTIRGFGLVPATALCVFSGAFASREITAVRALLLTLALTAFSVVLFVFVLGQPIVLFRPL